MAERFGKEPPVVENLFAIGAIKYLAQKAAVLAISQEKGRVVLTFGEGHPLTGEILLRLAALCGKEVSFQHGKKFTIRIAYGERSAKAMLEQVIQVLHQLITLLSGIDMV